MGIINVQRVCRCHDEECYRNFWISRNAWSEPFNGFCPFCGADASELHDQNDFRFEQRHYRLEDETKEEYERRTKRNTTVFGDVTP
ncbi:hypothetical protein P7F88_19390 [Vibrio hannami]|uniref:hypothetical protein n=1 Tax=Vibrio hannami TaxID=2717094 RepID=UPI00240ED992|nr:hypothetical protein [Vibrio hannami]MDG3088121.1 hypothetical protein [Vibrio hannami]